MIDVLLRFLKRLLIVAMVGIVLFVAALTYLGGETTTVTARNTESTACAATIAGQCARHLTTPSTTTRVAPTTTLGPVYGPELPTSEDGPLIVVDGTHVYYLPRNPLTVQMLWIATKGL